MPIQDILFCIWGIFVLVLLVMLFFADKHRPFE